MTDATPEKPKRSHGVMWGVGWSQYPRTDAAPERKKVRFRWRITSLCLITACGAALFACACGAYAIAYIRYTEKVMEWEIAVRRECKSQQVGRLFGPAVWAEAKLTGKDIYLYSDGATIKVVLGTPNTRL